VRLSQVLINLLTYSLIYLLTYLLTYPFHGRKPTVSCAMDDRLQLQHNPPLHSQFYTGNKLY